MNHFFFQINRIYKFSLLFLFSFILSLFAFCSEIPFRQLAVFASKGYPFKNIFDFTTAGDWDCVAAVERLPALHYSVDFIFLSFGIMGFIVELGNY